MSRAGYSDDLDPLDFGRWRARVRSATYGKRGQEFCRGCRIIWLQDGLEDRERQLARDKAELEMLLKEGT